ncbi:hypothetical protein PPERSA_08465 [Pseudocohnilembus persalinus]|uniref:Uncharacterized protein n=1 Tax=Pseudocohnilembus persalinus TaxID=266149 RepID=A0A0V0R6F6_PSEPJ|nr:hypothetical protein PPERSA_08465 [Pseudocohnilembus persalinus]|eukprot:KRX10062.1 hypothetical protein PPERSA_08465 [Pseudocohnilembus persalinus]
MYKNKSEFYLRQNKNLQQQKNESLYCALDKIHQEKINKHEVLLQQLAQLDNRKNQSEIYYREIIKKAKDQQVTPQTYMHFKNSGLFLKPDGGVIYNGRYTDDQVKQNYQKRQHQKIQSHPHFFYESALYEKDKFWDNEFQKQLQNLHYQQNYQYKWIHKEEGKNEQKLKDFKKQLIVNDAESRLKYGVFPINNSQNSNDQQNNLLKLKNYKFDEETPEEKQQRLQKQKERQLFLDQNQINNEKQLQDFYFLENIALIKIFDDFKFLVPPRTTFKLQFKKPDIQKQQQNYQQDENNFKQLQFEKSNENNLENMDQSSLMIQNQKAEFEQNKDLTKQNISQQLNQQTNNNRNNLVEENKFNQKNEQSEDEFFQDLSQEEIFNNIINNNFYIYIQIFNEYQENLGWSLFQIFDNENKNKPLKLQEGYFKIPFYDKKYSVNDILDFHQNKEDKIDERKRFMMAIYISEVKNDKLLKYGNPNIRMQNIHRKIEESQFSFLYLKDNNQRYEGNDIYAQKWKKTNPFFEQDLILREKLERDLKIPDIVFKKLNAQTLEEEKELKQKKKQLQNYDKLSIQEKLEIQLKKDIENKELEQLQNFNHKNYEKIFINDAEKQKLNENNFYYIFKNKKNQKDEEKKEVKEYKFTKLYQSDVKKQEAKDKYLKSFKQDLRSMKPGPKRRQYIKDFQNEIIAIDD